MLQAYIKAQVIEKKNHSNNVQRCFIYVKFF